MKIELQNVLRRELKSRKLTINALAVACRIPASVLHGWVNGVLPSAKNLHHIGSLSRNLNLPISVLLFDKDEGSERQTISTVTFQENSHVYRVCVERLK